MTKILFLSANPKGLTPLKLYEEIYEVRNEVDVASFGSQFEFEAKPSVKWRDISELLRTHKPDILHFSGHGSESSDIIFEDEYGNSQPVSEDSIRTVFRHLKGNIRCVVLNACYSESQAIGIAEYVDCVIGTSSEIPDQEAIKFSLEFYRQLANGESVLTAYEMGCTHVTEGKKRVKLLNYHADASRTKFVQDITGNSIIDTAGNIHKNSIPLQLLRRWVLISSLVGLSFGTIITYFVFLSIFPPNPKAMLPSTPDSTATQETIQKPISLAVSSTLVVIPTATSRTTEVQPTRELNKIKPTVQAESVVSTTFPTFSIGEWQGTFTEKGETSVMIMDVKAINASTFSGEADFPGTLYSDASLTIRGDVLSKIDDTVEQSKWGFVQGYNPNVEQTLLFFTYGRQSKGRQIILSVTFRAVMDEKDGTIKGAWFYRAEDPTPGGNFNCLENDSGF